MPGISGAPTDFQLKWNDALKDRLYGPDRRADLDGEYIDSSEGYVTDELDFRRDHFAAADDAADFLQPYATAGHLPRVDCLRIRSADRPRRPRHGPA